jgi:hypothetical protein
MPEIAGERRHWNERALRCWPALAQAVAGV